MERYLIDTNVIANYFLNIFSEAGMFFLTNIIDKTPFISVITKIEALSWKSQNIEKENIVKIFVNFSNIIELSDNIVNKCIDIRRICRIKTPDAIIAATAIVNDMILITSDSDFKRIPTLKIINPFNL